MNVSMWSNDIFGLDQLAPFELRPTRAKSQDAFDETSGTPRHCYASPGVKRSGRPAKRARVEDIRSCWPVGEMKQDPVQRAEGTLLTTLPEEPRPTRNGSPHANLRGGDSCETTSGTKSGNLSLEPEKAMADVFKYELSRAVSHSVDSLFKSMPLIRVADGSSRQVLDVQTEALSLVVRGPREEASKWLKVRSEAESGSTEVPSVCFPRVKMESSGLLKNHRYSLNEGLTTQHLKKAKLMFFYTRYPSSPVLKMCFHDVQFTRCIGSQLIKWFSNFREFYYIQMEKFARRAVAEGSADAVEWLSVGRESQLFRALNVHYNKSGDFQVPNGFLQVAEITLRQFYTAISTGKDREPSWKKAIYKVICKLDADVPAQFKT